jgi:hypothetical protein
MSRPPSSGSSNIHIYDLRLADTHLAASETDATLQKLGPDVNLPFVTRLLLDALSRLVEIVRGTPRALGRVMAANSNHLIRLDINFKWRSANLS